jgi:hypothetical protein
VCEKRERKKKEIDRCSEQKNRKILSHAPPHSFFSLPPPLSLFSVKIIEELGSTLIADGVRWIVSFGRLLRHFDDFSVNFFYV